MNHDVFISYSTRDKNVAEAVCKSLEKDGIRCWIAPRDIHPGVGYADAIIDALNTCQVFLVILSEESNSSPQVRREVERAVSKDLSILTFRIDNTILSKAMEYYLSDRHWLDASNMTFSKQLHSLSEAVQKLLRPTKFIENEEPVPKPIEVQVPAQPVQQVVEEMPSAPPTSPTMTQKKRPPRMIWMAGLILLILSILILFGLVLKGTISKPGPAMATNALLATKTNIPISTSTRNEAATASALLLLTSEAQDFWIQNFSEPVLEQIAKRLPDFQDDFSNPDWSYSHWRYFDGVMIKDGQVVVTLTDQSKGMDLIASTSDFVFTFKITLIDFSIRKPMLGFSFRGDVEGQAVNHFTTNLEDGWCGFGESGHASRNMILSDLDTCIMNFKQVLKVTIIVQGDQAAAYVNDQPKVHLKGLLHLGNDIGVGVSVPEGTGTMTIDNVEIWYLK